MVTEQEAKDMREAIRLLEQTESQQVKVQRDINIQTALDWWDTIKPDIPTTRQEALTVHSFIKGLLETETDQYKLTILRKKLEEANEKFQEIKRNG